MAVYKVEREVLIVPYKYVAANGKPADHEEVQNENVLAVDERGNPEYANATLTRGTLVYTDGSSLDGLEDEQKKHAFFTDSEPAVNRYVEKGALSEVETQPKKQQSSASNKSSKSSKSNKSDDNE